MARRVPRKPTSASDRQAHEEAQAWRERWERRIAALVPNKASRQPIIEGLKQARERRRA